MSFWRRLLHALGLWRPEELRFDQEILGALQDLAERERRPTDEVAEDLLYFALAQREAADENLRCWRMLTPREQEVTALVCLGYTNRRIASCLTISPETVKTHVYNALHKFGLRRKAEMRMLLAEWDFSAWEDYSPRE
jgi:DNA-binding CsgD family transcriptional regulator